MLKGVIFNGILTPLVFRIYWICFANLDNHTLQRRVLAERCVHFVTVNSFYYDKAILLSVPFVSTAKGGSALESANCNAESDDSTTDFTIVGRLSISNMF